MLVVLGAVLVHKAHLYAPTQIMREREAELIYRGEHLARGIALYRQRTNRYPTSLGEVESLRPRLIRQAYKDPMTETGEWAYMYNVPTSPSGNNDGLPIIGVRSKSMMDSIKIYRNKSLYSDWEFSALDPAITGMQPGQQQVPNSQQQGGQGTQSRPANNPSVRQ
jgi:hypothetical protein